MDLLGAVLEVLGVVWLVGLAVAWWRARRVLRELQEWAMRAELRVNLEGSPERGGTATSASSARIGTPPKPPPER